jgi:hypothetical protein
MPENPGKVIDLTVTYRNYVWQKNVEDVGGLNYWIITKYDDKLPEQ